MEFTSKKRLAELLGKHKIAPLKRFGQNFLIDEKVLRKLMEAASLHPQDIVLEVGPGTGNLTSLIALKVKKVVAVEKDRRLLKILKEITKDLENVEVIRENILKFQTSRIKFPRYKLIGNLPFYLTAPLIRKFLEEKNSPEKMIVIVQKEVGERICAKVPDMNILGVSVQFYSNPEILSHISKNSFWPRPEVDAVLLKITPVAPSRKFPAAESIIAREDFKRIFFRIVKAGFSQPRKQIINNLSKMLELTKEKTKGWLLKNNIDPARRAETLNLEDWVNLAKAFYFGL